MKAVTSAISKVARLPGGMKISYMLPTPNIVVSPTVGYVMGF